MNFTKVRDASQAPPRILQIVQERLRPGVMAQYGKVEEELADVCRRMRAPNPYLAFTALEEPIDVLWLNNYDSQDDVDRVAAGKEGMTDPAVEWMTAFREDLSGAAPWRIGELQYAAVRELSQPEKSTGVVFVAPAGNSFAFLAASTLNDAAESAPRLGAASRIFEVQRKWSLTKAPA